GACVGPLVAGLLMREFGTSMYFVFLSVCALVLVGFVRPQRVTGAHLSQDAPTQFVPMSDSLQSSNVVANLDPRVDVGSDVSFVTREEEGGAPHVDSSQAVPFPPEGEPAAAEGAGQPESARNEYDDSADGEGDAEGINKR